MEARKLVACQGLFFLHKFVLLEWKQSPLYSHSAPSPNVPPSELAAKQKAAGTTRARLHWLSRLGTVCGRLHGTLQACKCTTLVPPSMSGRVSRSEQAVVT